MSNECKILLIRNYGSSYEDFKDGKLENQKVHDKLNAMIEVLVSLLKV